MVALIPLVINNISSMYENSNKPWLSTRHKDKIVKIEIKHLHTFVFNLMKFLEFLTFKA